MQMGELMISSPQNLPFILYIKVGKLLCFAQTCKRTVLISTYRPTIRANIILHLFKLDIRQVLLSHSWNKGFSSFLWSKYMDTCVAMTSLTHSFAYSYRLFKKCFDNNCGNSKLHIFLIIYSTYLKLSLFCLNFLLLLLTFSLMYFLSHEFAVLVLCICNNLQISL